MVRRAIEKDAMHIATTDKFDMQDSEDLKALAEALQSLSWPTPENQIAAAKAFVSRELTRKGWPDPSLPVRWDENGWEPIDGELRRENLARGWTYDVGLNYAKTSPRLSFPALLAEIYSKALSAERALASGDVGKGFDAGMRLAQSVAIYNARAAHLRKADVGDRQVKAGKRGNDGQKAGSFASLHGREAQAMAERLYQEKPSRTWQYIRSEVAKAFRVSPETVKKALRNPKKVG